MQQRFVSRCTLAGVVAALILSGCDVAPGPDAPGQSAPVVSDLQYSPAVVVVDDEPPENIVDGSVRLMFSISVSATDPDNDVHDVSFLIVGPDEGSGALVRGSLASSGDARYAADVMIDLPIALTGRYTVLAYASDRSGRLGNEVRGALDLLASGSPPNIESVTMPERVVRPAEGEPPLPVLIQATVSDPDGLTNVSRVEVVVNGQFTLRLCDDGGAGACNFGASSGDLVPNDGTYTLTLQIESTNAAATNTFVFRAIDRSGQASATVQRTIVVE